MILLCSYTLERVLFGGNIEYVAVASFCDTPEVFFTLQKSQSVLRGDSAFMAKVS